MANQLARRRPDQLPGLAIDSLLIRFIQKQKKETTRKAYAWDLADFTRFVQQRTADDAIALLIAGGRGSACRIVEDYKIHLAHRKLASATIARRLTVLRSLITCARRWEYIDWEVDVESPRVEQYRDVTGPGRDGWVAIRNKAVELVHAPGRRGDPMAQERHKRDWALLRLMYYCGLRRGECLALDLADVELERSRVHVIGKGKDAPKPLTVNDQAREALAAWIEARGPEAGPLFTRLDPGSLGHQRLTGEAARRIVAKLSIAAGLPRPARPHGLRHAAITRANQKTNGNARMTQEFARHSDPKTTDRYIKADKDNFGAVGELLARDDGE